MQSAYPIANISAGSWLASTTEVVRNLLTYTESFDNAAWSKFNSTIPAADSVTDPDGGLTAETLVENSSDAGHFILGGTGSVLSVPYTFKVCVRPNGRNWTKLKLTGINVGAFFNVATGAIGTVEAGITASIIAIGNSYYQCVITGTAGLSSTDAEIFSASADGVSSFVGSGATALDISRAQLEQASSASAYQPILATTPPAAALYSMIDETSADDADYIYTQTVDDTCKLYLTQLPDPLSNTSHNLHFRGYGDELEKIEVALYCGDLLIAGTSQILTSTPTTYLLTLSAEQANSISNYHDLRIWVTSRQAVPPAVSYEARITWVDFETPDGTAVLYSNALSFGAAA